MRLLAVVFLFGGLLACQSRESPPRGLNALAIPSKVEKPEAANLAESAEGSVSAGPEAWALNLSLDLLVPLDIGGAEAWGDETQSRYQVGEWFRSSAGGEESRLKMKPKLLLKEQSKFKGSVSAYADNVNGAEVGFEYKTR